MIILNGSYECKADAKGRLLLPAPLKKQLTAVLEDGFVLKRSIFDKCVEMWPIAEWNKMMQKMAKLNPFDKKNSDFINKFTAGVKQIELDEMGRLLLAKDLLTYAKIDKEVVFSSKINIIQIWDKTIYEKSISFEEDDFAELTQDIMSKFNDFE